jgi:hypothetical protein
MPLCEADASSARGAGTKLVFVSHALRTYTLTDGLELDGQCVHQREEGTGQEEYVAQVCEERSVFKKAGLYHCFVTHCPLVDNEAEQEYSKANEAADDSSACPGIRPDVVHTENETGEASGYQETAVDV